MMIQYMMFFRQKIESNEIIIYFFDNHKSHMTLELAKICRENRIIAIGLYPNSTRIIQPLDVGLFGGLKTHFKTLMDQWTRKPENIGCSFEIADLAEVINQANMAVATVETIKNAFRKVGIYPWNADNIDYSRCLGKNIPASTSSSATSPASSQLFDPPASTSSADSSPASPQVFDLPATQMLSLLYAIHKQNTQLLSILAKDHPEVLETISPVVIASPLADFTSAFPVDPTSSIKSILVVPEKPMRKGGRTIRALPYVVSSNEYINLEEEVLLKKQVEEDRKQTRRDELAEKKRQRFERTQTITRIKQEKNEVTAEKNKRKAETVKEVLTKPKRGRPSKKLNPSS